MLKIKLNSSSQMTAEQIAAVRKPKSRWIKDTGVQTVTIDEVTNLKKDGTPIASKDPNWATLKIVVSNTKGEKLTDLISVPLTGDHDFLYQVPGKDPSSNAFIKLCSFLDGLGVAVSDKTSILTALDFFFGDSCQENLIGSTMNVDIQYRGLNIRYVGKDAEGKPQYQLHNWDRPYQLREDSDEVAPIVTSYEACLNHALSIGVEKNNISGFPSIREILPKQDKIELSSVESDSEVSEDMPF